MNAQPTSRRPRFGELVAICGQFDPKLVKMCLAGERAETFVVQAGPEFKLLARNSLDPEPCLATPALVGDSLLIRTASKLYRIRNSTPSSSASVRRGNSIKFPFNASVKLLKNDQMLRGANASWRGSRQTCSTRGNSLFGQTPTSQARIAAVSELFYQAVLDELTQVLAMHFSPPTQWVVVRALVWRRAGKCRDGDR